MSADYRRLVDKVDETTAALSRRLASELACGPGCASCCHVELTVVGVEADAIAAHVATLPLEVRAAIHARATVLDGRCVMLDDRDLCRVFPVRPLVCRTQGLPLLYPEDTIPIEAILRRTPRGAITACPLNFQGEKPNAEDAIDAERMDTMLGLVDRLDARERGIERPRTALRDLARSA